MWTRWEDRAPRLRPHSACYAAHWMCAAQQRSLGEQQKQEAHSALLPSPFLPETRGKASLREVPSLHVEQRSSLISQDTGRRAGAPADRPCSAPRSLHWPHPQAVIFLPHGPPGTTSSTEIAGLFLLVFISSLRLHLRENVYQINVHAFLLLLFLPLQFPHSTRDPKRVKESLLLSYRRNQTKTE